MVDDISSELGKLSPLQRAVVALKKKQLELDAIRSARTEPIAIIGMGCRFPEANNPDAYWQLLHDGIDTITEVPRERWDIDTWFDPDPEVPGKVRSRHGGFVSEIERFDPLFFGISPREAVEVDPQQRLLLEVTWEALESAGQPPDKLGNRSVGVFIGVWQTDYLTGQVINHPENITAYTGTGGGLAFNAGRLSYVLGLQGPAFAMDTSCSSSLLAVHLACQSLRTEESELSIAGGVNLNLLPGSSIFFSKVQALSPDGRCKTFDASADGYVRGEGCGIVVLKRLSDAIADKDNILALIRGSAINHDGASSGITVPNGLAQEKVIRQALRNAGVTPAEVSYIEAHGTGTPLGDPIEVGILGTVFGENHTSTSPLTIGSVKTNIGHLESAAGIAGLMKIVLAMRHEEIPPHLHFKEPNPHIDWANLPFRVPVALQPWLRGQGNDRKPRIAGVSSFGMSGTNAHVVLEEAPVTERLIDESAGDESSVSGVERPFHLLTLSARSEATLRDLTGRYADYLEAHPEIPLADVCFTAYTGRSHFAHRLALVAGSSEDAGKQLRAMNYKVGRTEGKRPRIAFLFTGQGAQYVGMGRQLYETEPLFREMLERCDEILRPLGVPLLDLLYGERRGYRRKLLGPPCTRARAFRIRRGILARGGSRYLPGNRPQTFSARHGRPMPARRCGDAVAAESAQGTGRLAATVAKPRRVVHARGEYRLEDLR
uniref:Ketoacyl-synthetase C-terminal extension n=1 Tax=Candidatus Kentrum sp. TUN TaxID=2126343 RepID=A0A451A962_9GAMM|nr:MAG: Ketoacyl-synthetase C-terminal extension [Candidatus Kentron sp. TUN]